MVEQSYYQKNKDKWKKYYKYKKKSLPELEKIGRDSEGKFIKNHKIGHKGIQHSKESIEKMLRSRKPLSEESRRKISIANTGRIVSNAARKKLSESSKGKIISKEARKKLSIAGMGSKNSQAKKYIVTTPERKEIFVHGIKEFCRNYEEEKLHYKGLTNVAKKKYKQR